ncbi:MAG: TerD family protein [Blastocatellia bacterium]
MALSLQKGQKTDLTKGNPQLARIVVGLGWDTNKYDGGHAFDLDAAAFLLNSTGKVDNDSCLVFYNNLKGANETVVHQGDNLTGQGDGDDEQIKVNLKAVPDNIQRIAFTVTIHDAEARSQTFGQVSNAFIRVFNEDNNQEILRYDLSEDYSVETALVVGELYRHAGEWKFSAIGSGFAGGLYALCKNFGVNV